MLLELYVRLVLDVQVWQKSTVLSGERVLSLFGVTETFQTSVPAAAAAVYDIGVAGIISQP